MKKNSETKIVCRQCGKDFVFTNAEREFYGQRGFVLPRRCKDCRSEKQNESYTVCIRCGSEIQKDASTCCTTCLENVQSEFEMKTKKIQKAANEAYAKLQAFQREKTELEEALSNKEQAIRDLKCQIDKLSKDLQEMHNLYATLNEWFQPTLNGVEERMKERLRALEHGQDKINERMLQMVKRMYELYENITILDLVKRGLKGYQKRGIQPT